MKLLKLIQGEKRNATPEEKAELVQFTGWGALSQAFDEDKAGYVTGGGLGRLRVDLTQAQERVADAIKYGHSAEYWQSEVERLEPEIRRYENWEKKWGGHYKQIKDTLTESEWRRARASTINAHYTEGGVVSLMWDAAVKMGFRGGNVGEMAVGIGHFYGLMPQELQDRSKLFGVEMDPISAGIAQLLYPEADIQAAAFQQADVADNSLDLQMGNVPFANIAIVDPAIKALDGPLDNLHDYYFAKMLQKARPGGLIVAISSAFTLDKMNPTNRKWLAERADLVAAYRLPNDAFKENAGTDVVTDIIILRKKDGAPFEHGKAWTTLGNSVTAKGDPIRVNEYFAAHPGNVLGLLADDGEMFAGRDGSKEMTVHSDPNRPADVALAQAIDALPADIVGPGAGMVVRGARAAGISKMGNIVRAADGNYYFNTGGEQTVEGMSESDKELNLSKNRPRVAAFLGVRDALNRQYDLELSDTATDEEIEENRADLNRLYDAFKGRFENFHHRANKSLFIDDPDYFRLAGAEVEAKIEGTADAVSAMISFVRGKGKKYVKADVFSRRVLAPRVEPTHADSIEDALGMSLGWRGRVDTAYIAQLTGMPREDVESALLDREIVLRDPDTGQIQSREQYLSGNVRKKLEVARAAGAGFERNVALLQTAQPADVAIADIRFSIGATWIPPAIYREFMETIGVSVGITYETKGSGSDKWVVASAARTHAGAVRYKDFEAGNYNAWEMLGALLNMRRIEVRDSARDGGKVNPAATALAQNKANELKAEFERWAKDAAGDRLAAIYNREVNGHALRTYDGQHLTFPWASTDFNIFPDKKNTVWRAIQEGFGLIAHGVGGGKTIVGTAIGLELRRLGFAKKPMLVVHNATLEQFATTIAQIAPAARVLVGRKDELKGAKRKEFLMRIAAGDWDAVVVAHSTFNLIADDPAMMQKQMENLVDELTEAILGEGGHSSLTAVRDDRKKSASVKKQVKMIEELEAKIADAAKRTTDTDILNFQQLGVDALIVDEVHKFKKMPFATKLDVKGIDGGMSKSGYGLLMRARGIQEKNGGKNIFTMTGTPVTNTLGEVWNQVRLVAPHLLKEYGVEKFDQFVSKFATVESKSESDPTGARKMVDRLARIINLPEWATFFRMAADVKLGDDLVTAGRPEIKGGKAQLVAAERTVGATAWVNYIRQVLAAVPEARKDAMQAKDWDAVNRIGAIPVTAYMASRAAAIDIRLIEPRAMDEPGSKVNLMLERAMGIYQASNAYKGTQVIFADSMNPTRITSFDEVMATSGLEIPLDPLKEPGATFHLYDDIRMKLIKRGVPAAEIAVMSDKKYQGDAGEKAKKDLWEKVNAGEVRFVLGSTEKLGTGVNMQRLMAAAHHLDVPWTPAGLEQRDGRVFRQGNLHMEFGVPIELIRYGMKDTLDEALWGILERKQRFITSALSGKLNGRDIEEDEMTLSLGEQMAILSGPYGQEMFELDNRIRELEYSRQAHAASGRRRTEEIKDAKEWAIRTRAEMAAVAPKLAKLDRLAAAVAKDGAKITVDGEAFETKKAMLEAVDAVLDVTRADWEGKAETFDDVMVPSVTALVVNGVPVTVGGWPYTQTIYGEQGTAIGDRKALAFALEGEPWTARDSVKDHFGEVRSAATLVSRLEELAGRVANRRDTLQRNLDRYTALANMDALGAWAYQDEFDRKTARAAEVVKLMAGGKTADDRIIAPVSTPLLGKVPETLEVRIAPAAVVSVAGNFNFEEAVDFDHWTVSAGPGSALTDYTSTTSVIRGAFAPEGNAYAHLSFEGRATIGTTGFGPSIQSENFSAAAGEEISVAWRATNGIDTAHPRGRLFASNGTPVGTFFDADSGTTAFTNATVTVPSDGEYYLLFEAGSSDASVGGLVGATLDIDAIHRTPDGITTTTLPNGQSSVDVSGSSLTGNTFLITLDDTSQFAQIFVNGNLNFIQPLSSIDRINITGGDANDQLTVDSSRGLIPLAEGIHFNGGASSDTLSLIQTGGLSNVTDTFSVGPGLGDGISEISDGTLVQTVNFQNVEPVLDNVASASLTVNATTADNTITSTDGPGGGSFTGATALITIDGFATFEFNNKTSLTLNALAGSDTISLNNSSTPAGLTGALIQGGDPSLPVGDTLHFANAGSIHPVAIGTGTITASGFPTVNFTGMEATAVGGYTLTRGGGGLLVTATGDQDFTGQEDAFVITTSASDQFLRMELNGSIGLYANQRFFREYHG